MELGLLFEIVCLCFIIFYPFILSVSSHGSESDFMKKAMVEEVGVGCTAVSGVGCDEVR